LAEHIPNLWNAETTTAADRKAIARQLIDRVVVAVREDSEYVNVTIHWRGGLTSTLELVRPVGRYEQLRDYAGLLRRILELRAQGRSTRQIAEHLNQGGGGRRGGGRRSTPRWCGNCCPGAARPGTGSIHREKVIFWERTSGGSVTWPANSTWRRRRCTLGCAGAGSRPGSWRVCAVVGLCGRTQRNWTGFISCRFAPAAGRRTHPRRISQRRRPVMRRNGY
jgi:hypothetical protein